MAKKTKKTWRPNFIESWRRHRGLTQEQLAEKIGRSTATVSQLENSNTPYGQGTLEKIAEALNCTHVDLLTRRPDEGEDILALWNAATPEDRQKILNITKTIIGSR